MRQHTATALRAYHHVRRGLIRVHPAMGHGKAFAHAALMVLLIREGGSLIVLAECAACFFEVLEHFTGGGEA